MREIFVDPFGNLMPFPNVSAYIGRAITRTVLAEDVTGEPVLVHTLGDYVNVPPAASSQLAPVQL